MKPMKIMRILPLLGYPQEITQKLLEAVGEIAGASLEQTTFFRRNLAVKPGPQIDVTTEVDDTTTDQEAEGMFDVKSIYMFQIQDKN